MTVYTRRVAITADYSDRQCINQDNMNILDNYIVLAENQKKLLRFWARNCNATKMRQKCGKMCQNCENKVRKIAQNMRENGAYVVTIYTKNVLM